MWDSAIISWCDLMSPSRAPHEAQDTKCHEHKVQEFVTPWAALIWDRPCPQTTWMSWLTLSGQNNPRKSLRETLHYYSLMNRCKYQAYTPQSDLRIHIITVHLYKKHLWTLWDLSERNEWLDAMQRTFWSKGICLLQSNYLQHLCERHSPKF